MADYIAAMRTNYFRVKNEEAYQKAFLELEADIQDFSEEKDGVVFHGFGGYTSFDDDSDFLETMKGIIAEDDAMIIYEIGHEKLRYLSSYAIIVTAKEIKSIGFPDTIKETAKALIGKSDWETNMEY